MPGKRLTADERAAIRQLWAEGLSARQVAERVGRSHRAVERWLLRNGCRRGHDPRAIPAETRRAILAHWIQGMSRRRLVKRYQVSVSTVRRITTGTPGGRRKIRRLVEPLLLRGAEDGVQHSVLAREARMSRAAIAQAISRARRRERGR